MYKLEKNSIFFFQMIAPHNYLSHIWSVMLSQLQLHSRHYEVSSILFYSVLFIYVYSHGNFYNDLSSLVYRPHKFRLLDLQLGLIVLLLTYLELTIFSILEDHFLSILWC